MVKKLFILLLIVHSAYAMQRVKKVNSDNPPGQDKLGELIKQIYPGGKKMTSPRTAHQRLHEIKSRQRKNPRSIKESLQQKTGS